VLLYKINKGKERKGKETKISATDTNQLGKKDQEKK